MGIATKFNPGAIIKAYSLTMEHIAKVADMSQRTGHSQGQVVRDAIDLLWAQMEQNDDGRELH